MTPLNSWDDIIHAAARDKFVGRTQELGVFRAELTRFPPEKLVFFIWGQGGAGKSTLLEEYCRRAQDAKFSTALADEQCADIPAVLGRFFEQLSSSGFKLPTFATKYQTYCQHRNTIEKDPEAP